MPGLAFSFCQDVMLSVAKHLFLPKRDSSPSYKLADRNLWHNKPQAHYTNLHVVYLMRRPQWIRRNPLVTLNAVTSYSVVPKAINTVCLLVAAVV